MAKLEVDIEEAACDYAKSIGWLPCKLVNLGSRGWPDRWFFKPGPIIVLIEFKRPNEPPRKLQAYIGGLLAEMGFEVYLGVDNLDDAKRILDAERVPNARHELDVESGITWPRAGPWNG